MPAATVPAPTGARCCLPITRLREMSAQSAHDTLELEVFEVCVDFGELEIFFFSYNFGCLLFGGLIRGSLFFNV